MLKVKGIGVSYDQQVIVEKNDLVFPDGTITTIIGESGSGKTSILRKITLVEKDSSCDLFYNNQIMDEKIKRNVLYYANQENNFIQDLSCLDHFYLIGKMIGKEFNDEDIKQICKQVNLSLTKSTYPNQLSGGEKQRFSIALALAKDCSIFVFDEITSSLDDIQGQEIMNLLKCLAKQNKTIILTSHNEELYNQSDRIYAITNNQIRLVKDVEIKSNIIETKPSATISLFTMINLAIKRLRKQGIIQTCFTIVLALMIAVCGVGIFSGKQYSTQEKKQAEIFKKSPAYLYLSDSNYYLMNTPSINQDTLEKLQGVEGVLNIDPVYRFEFNQKYLTKDLEEINRPILHYEYTGKGSTHTVDLENTLSTAVYSYNDHNQMDYYCKEVNTAKDGIYISYSFAWQLGIEKLDQIDTLKIPIQVPIATKENNYLGISTEIIEEKEVRGILRVDYPEFHGNYIYMNETEMIHLLENATSNFVYPNQYQKYQPNLYYAYLDNTIPFEQVENEIKDIDSSLQLKHMIQSLGQNLKPLVQNQNYIMIYVVGLVAVILIVSFIYSFFEYKEHHYIYLVVQNMGLVKAERNTLFLGELIINSIICIVFSSIICLVLLKVLSNKGILYINSYTTSLIYVSLFVCLIMSILVALTSHCLTWKKHV